MPLNAGSKLRRVITTHTNDKSAILEDNETTLVQGFASQAATLWRTHEYPAELYSSNPLDGNPEIYTKGTLIRVVDFPPNSQGHNHRTASLDYGIVLSGELELVLDDGSRTIVRAGDIVVQQATMHQWNNLSDQATRVVFVLGPSQKPEVNGESVAESGIPEKFLPSWS